MKGETIRFYCERCGHVVVLDKEDAEDEIRKLGWSLGEYILCPHCNNELRKFIEGQAVEEK